MRNIITNNQEKCVGCNRCIRECPIEEANIAYDTGSKIAVKIDNKKCIACASCISVCPHNSRGFEDDTERFFNDLRSGIPISIFSAPALKTNFKEWEYILSWLRKLGVHKIYDVSLGADICTWAHIRYLQKNMNKHIITQPCPAIVNYITKHCTDLLSSLSPIHSPMLCTAIYMKKYEGITTKLAALSPCIAKSSEFESTGLVEYNVTFSNLSKYIEKISPSFSDGKSGFDNYESGLGFLYPMPGGLKENVEYYLGKSLRIDKSEGPLTVYKSLDEYSKQSNDNLPVIFDVLNCAEGCNCGTGCVHGDKSIFEIHTTLDNVRQNSISDEHKEYLSKLYNYFDKTLRLEDFIRRYAASPVKQIPITTAAIEEAFVQLGKNDEASRNFNCGACGSTTCKEMAIKVAKGINIPSNCIEKAHRDVSAEHSASIEIQSSNVGNLNKIMDNIEGIKSIMEDIISNMKYVTESIDDFGQMTSDIQRIAMQINIISLNASIEAARAGQYGKAFGVVAEEIRSLANNSKASVQHSEVASCKANEAVGSIGDMISQISNNINEFHTYVAVILENTKKIINKT